MTTSKRVTKRMTLAQAKASVLRTLRARVKRARRVLETELLLEKVTLDALAMQDQGKRVRRLQAVARALRPARRSA